MEVLNHLITTLPEGNVVDVSIGIHWTAVVVEGESGLKCGLASTLKEANCEGTPVVPQAGILENLSTTDLTKHVFEGQSTMTSVAVAAINALLPQLPGRWVDLNAEEVIAERGADKSVVLVGHFPFASRLKERVGELRILELDPKPGDLPVSSAADVIPISQVVAITSMTLINHSLEKLLNLCDSGACIILLGPSTPLSPVMFKYGVDYLCGSVVTEIAPVMRAVRQGGNFRQIHKAGVRLVTVAQAEAN